MNHSAQTNQSLGDVTGERMAALMWRHRLTNAALGRLTNRDPASISLKMNGHRRWSLEDMRDIARVLETTVGYLLGETDDDRRPEHLPKLNTGQSGSKKASDASASEATDGRAELDPATSRL